MTHSKLFRAKKHQFHIQTLNKKEHEWSFEPVKTNNNDEKQWIEGEPVLQGFKKNTAVSQFWHIPLRCEKLEALETTRHLRVQKKVVVEHEGTNSLVKLNEITYGQKRTNQTHVLFLLK